MSLWQCGPTGEPTLLQELPHAGDVTDITVSTSTKLVYILSKFSSVRNLTTMKFNFISPVSVVYVVFDHKAFYF